MVSISARPAAGPTRIAIAAARFSSTTGDGSARSSTLVERLLGEIEVAEEADERRENPAGLRSVDRVHRVAHVGYESNSMIGRTSMLPMRDEGILAATWMASLRSFASIR